MRQEREDTPSDISNQEILPPPKRPRRSCRDATNPQISKFLRSIRKLPDSPINKSKRQRLTDSPFIVQNSKDSDNWTTAEWLDALGKGATMHTNRKMRAGTFAKSKDVAKALDPNQGQCLLTRNLPGRSVQGCHLISQEERDNDELLTRLEYLWGLIYGRLNLDEPRNLAFIEATLHVLLDNDDFALVPEKDIVDRIMEHNATEDIRALYKGQSVFRYRLLPLSEDMRNIDRLRRGRTHSAPAWKIQSSTYRYPFAKFPILNSHVEPHFVIMNTGKKLLYILSTIQCLDDDAEPHLANFLGFQTGKEASAVLANIRSLYVRWSTAKVPVSFISGRMDSHANHRKCNSDRSDVADSKLSLKGGRKRAAPSDFDRPGQPQGLNKKRAKR